VFHYAEQAGVDALMIDISNNGGGEVPAGLNLARLMYPEVPCSMFENKYDIVFNDPMRIWATLVQPLLSELSSRWFNSDQVEDFNEHLSSLLGSLTKSKRASMTSVAEAMCILNLDHSETYCGDLDPINMNCSLIEFASSLEETPSLRGLKMFLENLLQFLSESNPWTMTADYGVPMNIDLVSYDFGGIVTNFMVGLLIDAGKRMGIF
jgi:hypothetical protein